MSHHNRQPVAKTDWVLPGLSVPPSRPDPWDRSVKSSKSSKKAKKKSAGPDGISTPVPVMARMAVVPIPQSVVLPLGITEAKRVSPEAKLERVLAVTDFFGRLQESLVVRKSGRVE